MANTIWKEVFLIMCSSSKENARNTERFSFTLRITDNYTLQTLCGAPHNVCNEEGKVNGLTPNRAVYGEPQAVEMTFAEMRSRFCEAENEGKEHLSGYIVFTQDSFDKPYDERSRTYGVSSNNKAFQSGMGGYSIFGSCLDGTDPCVRLDGYMFGENAWKIEKCYMMEPSREMLDIICGKFFIAYAPFEAERFQSLPPDLADKYREKFKYPERFMRVNNEIVAVPFKPVRADKER